MFSSVQLKFLVIEASSRHWHKE